MYATAQTDRTLTPRLDASRCGGTAGSGLCVDAQGSLTAEFADRGALCNGRKNGQRNDGSRNLARHSRRRCRGRHTGRIRGWAHGCGDRRIGGRRGRGNGRPTDRPHDRTADADADAKPHRGPGSFESRESRRARCEVAHHRSGKLLPTIRAGTRPLPLAARLRWLMRQCPPCSPSHRRQARQARKLTDSAGPRRRTDARRLISRSATSAGPSLTGVLH